MKLMAILCDRSAKMYVSYDGKGYIATQKRKIMSLGGRLLV
jgi:hypothetical protein